MERREFVKTAVAAAGAGALGAEGMAMAQGPARVVGQEFYQLRKYELRNGAQTALTQGYFERALIPGLGRLGWGRWGCSSWTSGRRRRRIMC